MAKHYLFLVHGMGDFADDWSKGARKLLADIHDTYRAEYNKGRAPIDQWPAFADIFEVKELNYNRFFESLRESWKKAGKAVSDQIVKSKSGADANEKQRLDEVNKYVGALLKKPSGDEFWATHALDVVLYRFCAGVAQRIRVDLAKSILTTLDKAPASGTVRWSILGHSLGTSVVHDTLHAIFSNPKTTAKDKPRATLVAMFANVSRLLEQKKPPVDVYESEVFPNTNSIRGACDYYLNAWHQWDPIPRVRPFEPWATWPDADTRTNGRYLDRDLSVVTSKEIHSLEHHLLDPRVHVPLFRCLTGNTVAFSKEIEERDQASYAAQHPPESFLGLLQELKKVRATESDGWPKILDAVRGTLKAGGTQ
jgi:hypothetical protein